MILDTNVYSALDRADAKAVNIINSQESVNLPVIVVAELRFGFLNGVKQKENSLKLSRFFSHYNLNIVYIGVDTANVYAEVAVFTKKSGRVLANNDIWIAALALENKMPLVTFDKDFSVFESFLGKDLIILE